MKLFTVSGYLLVLLYSGSAQAQDFSGPVFGLTAAPNDDLIAADAGTGAVSSGRGPNMPLPGATDLSPIGRGSMWATTGGAPEPTRDSGQGLHRLSAGTAAKVANLYAYEQANDPDGAGVDSNPFDVESLGGDAALVADAGANDLLRVSRNGAVELLAVFPPALVPTDDIKALAGCPNAGPFAFLCGLPPLMPAQAVPTSVALGPDGYYYVGELKGFPAPRNRSRIWRVSPNAASAACPGTDCELVFDGGFTSVIDLAFGPGGLLYVVELDEASWFAVEVTGNGVGGSINECDVYTLVCSVVAEGIDEITAIAFRRDGSLHATEHALIPPLARVIEIN